MEGVLELFKNTSLDHACVAEIGPEALASMHAVRHGLQFTIDKQPLPYELRLHSWQCKLQSRISSMQRAICETGKAILSHDISISEHGGKLIVGITCWMVPLKPAYIKKNILYRIKCGSIGPH